MTDGESLSPAEPSQAATKKKNLTLRVFSTIVGVPLLTFLIFAEASPIKYPAIIYVVAGMFFSTTAAIEFFAAARRRNYQPVTPLAVTAVALLQLYAWQTAPPGLGFILTSFFALLLTLALLHTVLTAKGDGAVVVNLGVTMTGVAYTGWLFSYLIRLRTMAGIPIVSPFGTASFGAWLALFVFFVTFAGDTAAFFVGRSLGRRPLSPRLSPGKTVEGSIGGIGGAVAMALLLGHWMAFPLWKSILLGVVCSVMGQMGDLFASALKRDLQTKDFGGALPGMGGVLDRFDSILFSAPITYYLFEIWK